MSNITTVYDTVIAALATLFPNKTRVPNAYSLEDNNETFLRDGYGLKIGSSSPAPSEFKSFNSERTFNIVLTNEFIATDSNDTAIDDVAKALLEDVFLLQKDFYNVDQLGIEASIESVELGPTSDIEEIFSGQKKFLTMEVGFLMNIRENL